METIEDGSGRRYKVPTEPGDIVMPTEFTYRKFIQEKIDDLQAKIQEAKKALERDDCTGVGMLLTEAQQIADGVLVNCHHVTPAMLDLKPETSKRLGPDD